MNDAPPSARPLRIALFCMGSLGGSTEVAVNLALELQAAGHHCDLFSYDADYRERLLLAGIRVHTPKSLAYPIFDHIQTDFGFLVAFDRLHRARPYDLVHIHYAVPLLHVMTNLRTAYGIPCVVTFHGSDVTIVPDLFDMAFLARMLAASEASITVASHFLAEKAAAVFRTPIDRIRIIPNTVSREFFEPPLPRPAEATPYFLHVSSLRPVKRAWDILLAMCCVQKKLEQAGEEPMPRLKVVGEGPDLPDLRLLAAKCQLGDRIEFCGRIDDKTELAALAAGATALILSSLTESQPLVALEAMALGVPVVCSNFTAAPELLGGHLERGWIFEMGDSHQLADTLLRILREPALAARIADRARAHVRAAHAPEAVNQAYLDLYQETIHRNGTAGS